MKNLVKNLCSRRRSGVCRLFGGARSAFVFVAALMAGQLALAPRASAMLTAVANHDHITIDFGYHGSTVSVKGVSEPGVDLVVKITAPDGHQVMKKKGKVGGLLWMNVGSLSFERTPGLYEVFSTRKLDEILSREELTKHVIGYDALREHVEIEPCSCPEERAKWFGELVSFKEASKLYVTSAGRIVARALPDGHQKYELMTDWPHQAPPGDYTVTVYAVKDGKVTEEAQAKVKVEQVGVVKTLAGMAEGSGALYGVLSIFIAISAGFGVGMILRKGGGAH